ncbi:MAG: lactococcin 972 family bacteriocin [Clostridium sp.]
MKKLLLAGVTLSLIVGSCMSASAAVFFQKTSNTRNLPGADNWNRGIYRGSSNYYLAYSYYYNSTQSHTAGAYIDGKLNKTSVVYGPGTTACINSESRLSFADAYCSAAAQNNSGAWIYVRDEGYGDYRTSSH